MAIEQRPFGKTGLRFPCLGLGLAALGRPGYINLGHAEDLASDYVVEAMQRRTHRMLDLAYKQGIRYFDAARSYGRAEDFLHSWLEDHSFKAEELHVGSKWGYTYTADWNVVAEVHEVKNHTLEVLQEQWSASKKLLPFLKIYQIHSATFESGVLENTAVLTELARLKETGVLIGLSLSGPQQMEVLGAAMLKRMDGVPLFDAVQATFNILEQSSGSALAMAAESGMGIIIKEALANGRLTSRNRNPEFDTCRSSLESIAKKHKTDIDAIALAYILAQPWAHIVLSGAATEKHLLANLEATDLQLSSDEMEALSGFCQLAQDYWAERSGMKWN